MQTKRTVANNALLARCKEMFNKMIYARCLEIMNQPMTTLDEREALLVDYISGLFTYQAWEQSRHREYLSLMVNPMAAWHMCDDSVYAKATRKLVDSIERERELAAARAEDAHSNFISALGL